jgi:hypothetical protein
MFFEDTKGLNAYNGCKDSSISSTASFMCNQINVIALD